MWSTKLCSAPVHLLSGHVALSFLKSPGLLSSHLSISSFHVLLSWPPATFWIVWVIHQLAFCSQNMNFDAIAKLSCVVWMPMNSLPLNFLHVECSHFGVVPVNNSGTRVWGLVWAALFLQQQVSSLGSYLTFAVPKFRKPGTKFFLIYFISWLCGSLILKLFPAVL